MKKLATLAALVITLSIVITGCGDKRSPGRIYVPDMAYSRAYETYAYRDSGVFTTDPSMRGGRIYYDNLPAAGTIKRGERFPMQIQQSDSGYLQSANMPNPYDSLSTAEMAEAGRLFNINCAICHGVEGKGNGPVQAKFGYVANLTEPKYWTPASDTSKQGMKDGMMFYSITYGKNTMGSYASQLNRDDRWKVIKYIRTLQEAAGAGAAQPAKPATAPTAMAAVDTAKKATNP
jgi:mono/diheme cytochrome c family protein